MIYFYLLFLLVIKTASCDLNLRVIKIKYYEIEKDVFVTGVFHKSKENNILLQGYIVDNNRRSKVKLFGCKIMSNNQNYTCSAKYSKYRKMDQHFFDIQVKYDKKILPKYLILNEKLMKIPHKLYNQYKYVVCTPAMYNYTKANLFIQRMESLKYFGVSKVVTYFIDASIEVQKVFRYYIKIGFLDLYKNDKHIEYDVFKKSYYGEVWKLNHCFNTYQENAAYIFNSDLDEVIWPVSTKNYDEMFKLLPESDIFYFVNRVFLISIENDATKDTDMFNATDSCTGKNRWNRKYVIASPYKYQGLEIHTAVYHNWFLTETMVDKKHAYIRHTKKYDKYVKKGCRDYKNPYNDDKSVIIRNKVSRVRNIIFNSISQG